MLKADYVPDACQTNASQAFLCMLQQLEDHTVVKQSNIGQLAGALAVVGTYPVFI